MPKAMGPKERQKIIDLLQEHGGNRSRVAKICGRSKSLVANIARAAGIESMHVHKTKRATDASKAMRDISRMDIILDILETGRDLLDTSRIEAKDYKDVVTGLAIGIDKHRLETGEATSRTDTQAHHDERVQRFDRLYDALHTARRTGADENSGGSDRSEPVDTNGS